MKAFCLILVTALGMIGCASTPGRRGSTGGSGSSGFSNSLNGGNTSFGLLAGIVNATQTSLNDMHARANVREGGISTKTLTQAYEGSLTFTYRVTGTVFAFQLRPSFFYERESGTAASGSHTYSVTGYSVFPLLRIYPLENEILKIFMHVGMGYGQVTGEVNEGMTGPIDNHVDFSGGSFGAMVGMGSEIAYSTTHTFSIEVDYRYLTFDRNIASKATGTFASNSLTQAQDGREVELDGNDLSVNMSGLMFMAGYNFYF